MPVAKFKSIVATQTNLQHRLFSILKQVNTNFSELELKPILAFRLSNINV